ncbi:hypothetical protein GWK08_05545 [Leptobacterium flavescens]|uniref:Uncharacterized protein n=1 Tax=Leptobacterium flavescens TaxID=472055 RepID=A0A6P0UPQ7_9FLAO|nr:hypothetical protein [Leptobacterium flavescens]NER12893.1 hypothetical protein [Leptobacterium flavescens]
MEFHGSKKSIDMNEETIKTEKEIKGLFYLIHRVEKEEFHGRPLNTKDFTIVANDIKALLQVDESFSGSTLRRIFSFKDQPGNRKIINIDRLVQWLVDDSDRPKTTFWEYIDDNKNEIEEYYLENKSMLDAFFRKYSPCKDEEKGVYHFANSIVKEINNGTYREKDIRGENSKIDTLKRNITYLEKQLSDLEAQNLQAVLDEEFYMEIRNYINLFGNNRLKPVLRNIMSNKLRTMNLKLDKAKKLHESIGTAGLLFSSVPNKEGLIGSIQKEFRGKLVKLYKEEY